MKPPKPPRPLYSELRIKKHVALDRARERLRQRTVITGSLGSPGCQGSTGFEGSRGALGFRPYEFYWVPGRIRKPHYQKQYKERTDQTIPTARLTIWRRMKIWFGWDTISV